MLDFVTIKTIPRKNCVEVLPEFIAKRSKDLMIRGKSFYAVWDEERGLWSTNEYDVSRMIDQEVYRIANQCSDIDRPVLKLMSEFSSKQWTEWQKYAKSIPDTYHELDDHIVFKNTKIKKTDYVSRTLDYDLVEQDTPAYEELISTLYDEEERMKLEWAIGAVISGDSKRLQKFIVLYGGPGTGKSTVLNIIQEMFQGYCAVFDSKELTRLNSSFALESFKDNPLVAIEHDGDLSRIEDNTRLNSIVSHEEMVVNEKFKSRYTTRFNSFLFLGTNKPVKITDAKSGILRRLIDVSPSGRKVSQKRYDQLIKQIRFEFGGIAHQCLKRYESMGYGYYDRYTPVSMMGETNDFFNFMEYNYDFFVDGSEEGISLSVAWKRYKDYCEDARVAYPYTMRVFRSELKNYFERFEERCGNRRSVYFDFKKDKMNYKPLDEYRIQNADQNETWLKFDKTVSRFDDEYWDCPAQYANDNGTPLRSWDKCRTRLKDLDTTKLHYVLGPGQVIFIDFDIKDQNGEKDAEANLKAASKWPPTYAELSKSGAGIHLLYVYEGDPSMLSRIYDDDIEVKVFTGKSSLRRQLTRCNDLPIAKISSGLPLKETKSMLKDEVIQSEKGLRELIKKNLNKEIHAYTKPSIDFVEKILGDAYAQGLKYDVRDMRPAVQNFALSSSHQADACLKAVSRMKFNSDEPSDDVECGNDKPIVFYDVEVFPNLFLVCWKKAGDENKVQAWINPAPEQIEMLIKNFRLIGFNNRKYDNHMIYACMMGYSPEQLYKLSQRIIDGDRDAFFGEAYNLSYTDIYDFLSAQNKMSLKKWEIKLGIHHHELGYRWDQPVPKEKWHEVADYCKDDVIATEATWLANQQDWMAREILAEWAELTPNDTTNNCTTRIIVGKDRNPQSQFVYTDLSTIFPGYRYDPYGIPESEYNEGAKIVSGKSIYRGEDPGEGGYVYAEPGMYTNAAVLDVASMHPHSLIQLNLFGDEYTLRFANIVKTRIYIKHKEYDKAKEVLPERLHKYLDDPAGAKKLANALKTAINSVYGLTSAKFMNKLKDPRNVDNIVAKYGALFMINLKYEVQKRGFTVIHIKTDSIKIANATPEIIQFVMDYGKEYGYTFEHECTYNKICLVNDAVYIAQIGEEDGVKLETPKWTATGTQFQVPYVFKTLFSKEKIVFEDMCETKSVTTAMYLDFNENLGEDEHDYRFVGKVGCFCPVIDGVGGGLLLREGNGKYSAVVGTKRPGKDGSYRWMEAEMVLKNRMGDCIDKSYYNHLVDEAVETISKYGDFEQFASDDPGVLPDWLRVDQYDADAIPFDMCINPPEAS